jgi:hypothetical protein
VTTEKTAYVVRAMEADGYLIGIYGPFEGVVAAEDAAVLHNRNGVKTDVMPLHTPALLAELDES